MRLSLDDKRLLTYLLTYILPRFRDIAGFLLRTIPPLFHPNFRGVPLVLLPIADAVDRRSEYPKLIIRVINFELV